MGFNSGFKGLISVAYNLKRVHISLTFL